MPRARFAPPARGLGNTAAAPPGPFAGRVFVMFGPPAAGKGTQCKLLAQEFGLVHISTGDVFRDLCERQTGMGVYAKEYMDKGCFVPDDLVLGYVRDRLSQEDVRERGCLLDGFPRTGFQAQELRKFADVEGVFVLSLPGGMLPKRAEGRRIDPETGDIYHLDFVPPPARVAQRVVRRDRDDACSFRQRVTVFNGQSRRVLPYLSGLTFRIEASLEPREVFDSMARILRTLPQQREAVAPPLEGVCSICFDEKATHLVTPCGHQCGCEECLSIVKRTSGRCPICRGPVSSMQRVFLCAPAGRAADAVVTQRVQHADIDDRMDLSGPSTETRAADDEWSEDGDSGTGDAPVTIAVAPCADVPASGGVVDVAVLVSVADHKQRAPADICCCIDVSGSMCSRATYEDEEGNRKDDGLSVLDIVKHAAKTVVKILQDGDRLAVVAFNERSKTVLELTEMTEAGKDRAIAAIDSLRPGGQTSIWAGLHASMESLRSVSGADDGRCNRLQATLLLTDGQPTMSPPAGHLAELQNYKDSHPGFDFQLNTFGFGYSLDSELLLDLATGGQGTFAFIPDALIVGTTFVNSVANILATLAQSSTLSLMLRGGAEFEGPASADELEETWGRSLSLGPMQYGQPRDAVVKLRVPPGSRPYLEAVLTYRAAAGGGQGRASVEAGGRGESLDARVARLRADVVRSGFEAVGEAARNKGREAAARVAALRSRVEQADADGRLAALKADVGGRMSKALQGKERFNRWGKHYLRALMRSHQLQVCTNFMDPGLQPYGGELFHELRDLGDTIFLSLPPPRPAASSSMHPTYSPTYSPQSSPGHSPVMNTYYAGAGGGCFAPPSAVRRLDASGLVEEVSVAAVRAGDRLLTTEGSARVRCVARIQRDASKALVALPEGLRMTPGHPVLLGGAWVRARDAHGAVADGGAAVVYNFVLDSCHVLVVNGIGCATWGHGLRGEVIGHDFFGMERVLWALAALPGWERGLVDVSGAVRDGRGQVVGLHCGAGVPAHFGRLARADAAASEFLTHSLMPREAAAIAV